MKNNLEELEKYAGKLMSSMDDLYEELDWYRSFSQRMDPDKLEYLMHVDAIKRFISETFDNLENFICFLHASSNVTVKDLKDFIKDLPDDKKISSTVLAYLLS